VTFSRLRSSSQGEDLMICAPLGRRVGGDDSLRRIYGRIRPEADVGQRLSMEGPGGTQLGPSLRSCFDLRQVFSVAGYQLLGDEDVFEQLIEHFWIERQQRVLCI